LEIPIQPVPSWRRPEPATQAAWSRAVSPNARPARFQFTVNQDNRAMLAEVPLTGLSFFAFLTQFRGERLEMGTMEKQKVQAVLDSFSSDVDVDAFLEKIAVLDDIERGEQQIVAGQTVPQDIVRERIERICR
jgi:hypothetical protein